MWERVVSTFCARVFAIESEIINVNMSMDKFGDSGSLQKDMERLDIEEKNGDAQR